MPPVDAILSMRPNRHQIDEQSVDPSFEVYQNSWIAATGRIDPDARPQEVLLHAQALLAPCTAGGASLAGGFDSHASYVTRRDALAAFRSMNRRAEFAE